MVPSADEDLIRHPPVGWQSYAVECPRCGAKPGHLCFNERTGTHWISGTHYVRRDAMWARYRKGEELPAEAKHLINFAMVLVRSKRRSMVARGDGRVLKNAKKGVRARLRWRPGDPI